MQTKFLLLALIYCFCLSCSVSRNSVNDCSKLRTGNFIYHAYNNTGMGHWTHFSVFINRQDSVEYRVSSMYPTDTSYFRIMWTGDCEYRQQLLFPKSYTDSLISRVMPKGQLIKIIKIEDTYYIEQLSRTTKDTIWILK